MTNIEKVNNFLNDAKIFSFVTVDENGKPKARPLGFHVFENDKLYFGVGTHKDCYKQIKNNPNVEIMAVVEGQFMRMDGTVKFVEDELIVAQIARKQPNIMFLYDRNNWKMGLFVLENAHVEFKGMLEKIDEFDL